MTSSFPRRCTFGVQTLAAVAMSCLMACAAAAHASTVVTLVGDKDGFGMNTPADTSFSFFDVGIGDPDGTDMWSFGTQSVSFDYKLPQGDLIGASLEVFSGGQGFYGPTMVLLNGNEVGELTDGGSLFLGDNYARRDTLDLTPYLSLLTGTDDRVSFVTGTADDGWVLDYAELRVISNAPEPAALAMMGAGLAAVMMAAARRRRRV